MIEKINKMTTNVLPIVKDDRHQEFLRFLLISQFRDVMHEGIMGMWEKEREARNERILEDKNGEHQRRVRGDDRVRDIVKDISLHHPLSLFTVKYYFNASI